MACSADPSPGARSAHMPYDSIRPSGSKMLDTAGVEVAPFAVRQVARFRTEGSMPAASARFSRRHRGLGICAHARRNCSSILSGRPVAGVTVKSTASRRRAPFRVAKIRNMNLGEMEIVARVDGDPRPRAAPEPARLGICPARHRSRRLGTRQCGCGQKECQATLVHQVSFSPSVQITHEPISRTRSENHLVVPCARSITSLSNLLVLRCIAGGAMIMRVEVSYIPGGLRPRTSATHSTPRIREREPATTRTAANGTRPSASASTYAALASSDDRRVSR